MGLVVPQGQEYIGAKIREYCALGPATCMTLYKNTFSFLYGSQHAFLEWKPLASGVAVKVKLYSACVLN